MKRRTHKWWSTEGVAGRTYRTQSDLRDAVREIIARQPIGVPIDGPDAALLIGVLEHHHHWSVKCGTGLRYLTVEWHEIPGYRPTRGIMVHRTDGTAIDISWTSALLPGGGQSTEQDIAAAARREVLDQVEVVRAERAGAPCEICGRALDGDCHVDHKPPRTFEALLRDWLAEEQVETVALVDHGTHGSFADRALAERWARYHAMHATLRLIHASENLSAVRRGLA